MLFSADPRIEGHRLHGPWKGCYSYEIGLKYRLIYKVDLEKRGSIAVGTHKVY